VIAAEQRSVSGKGKAEMVRGMARRVQHVKRPSRALDLIAMAQLDIRLECLVHEHLARRAGGPGAALAARLSIAQHLRPGARFQHLHRTGMVAVGMRHQNV